MSADPRPELPESLAARLPVVVDWIDTVLSAYGPEARPVLSYGFPRLSGFFSRPLLAAVRVVEVARVPFPPLSRLGIPQLARVERGSYSGLTLGNIYFV